MLYVCMLSGTASLEHNIGESSGENVLVVFWKVSASVCQCGIQSFNTTLERALVKFLLVVHLNAKALSFLCFSWNLGILIHTLV